MMINVFASPQPSPIEEALGQELEDALCRAIGELPARMRQCLLLRVLHGLDHQEIADLMHISIGAVGAHLHQARQHLARALRGGDPRPPDHLMGIP
jgi:RNA polymerase sigma factor (sigma-70 family)